MRKPRPARSSATQYAHETRCGPGTFQVTSAPENLVLGSATVVSTRSLPARSEMNLISSFDDSLRAIGRRLRGVPRQSIQIALPRLQLGPCSVAPDLLNARSVVYSVSVEPISSFDRALIDHFGCVVHGVHPTGMRSKHDDAPPARVPDESPLARLRKRMGGLGHQHIDLLRLNLAGGEYATISALCESELRPCQLLIDFHHHLPSLTLEHTEQALHRLNEFGYRIFDCQSSGRAYSLALV
jgi:hypothetical protein